ncbi:uncharacterized protein ATC70_003856 [Mucor velutinosus]|uniref:Uncharacterized protein n=1 Tax=Mucor velutinosus TaxID=708070 RepID=A0AAN7D7A7_9FUNG|nr:hypothetical protein ATC70_003856 [Mucor velutinosus]
MAFSHKKFSHLDWLQSEVDDYSVYLNQLNQGYMNVPEEAALLNAINENHIANDSSVNQGHKIATEGYHNHASCVKEWCKSARQVDGPVSTDAVMHFNAQQPDSSACSSKVAEGNSKTHSDSQDDWFDEEEDDNEPYIWEDDHDSKSFSSWLLYGSDDDMEIFKVSVVLLLSTRAVYLFGRCVCIRRRMY